MSSDLLDALNALEEQKGISRDVLIEAIEAALVTAYKRNFNQAQNVRVDLNLDKGSIRVFSRKDVVEEVEDDRLQISLEDAKVINPAYQLEDIVEQEVTPRNFGRIAAQTAKQVVTQRVREAERGLIYEQYVDREDDIVTGVVERLDARNIYVGLGKVEAALPVNEQIQGESYHPHDRIKVYITKVERTTRGPQVIVSRTHPGLLRRLFEMEVPEIYEGIVEIKSIAREAGDRSKISVFAHNEEVDPVGSCVGAKGARVQTIVNELNGEKIDIVEWSEDPVVFVANALSPSKVLDVQVNEEEKSTTVVVPDYQLSLAIGKRGQNARLAAKLTGWKIDIKSETDARELGIYPSATSTFIPAHDEESDFDDVAVDLYQDDEE
ncbi:transcription termination factor NusA [Lysinibacillus capsici]|jgi:transcription termination/antitermination protein NusA|uniref:Transcription termination/antitermination protein NusA n=1 Tax=Lysinibacillus capsici TaxID=2115968 RepID=A0A2X0XL43_9BACI|nr:MULTISPECIES: transcription termination factor NusA [Lysinibacillus]AUS85773.1 transcription termination/antitermination protein NusA [Lysinibacillus sp. YS11]KMN40966.1 transcription elongation factor NusA [Lysinibacillus sp. LK3]MCR6524022.1 transcription termination factor NusA [Lysinibacillus capsici]MCT1541383.1 transcription termination factor NusA [Lysinibacillus capsici]MCT1572620.1 transcription termination factor NusA [Lysinibacillus capsici]